MCRQLPHRDAGKRNEVKHMEDAVPPRPSTTLSHPGSAWLARFGRWIILGAVAVAVFGFLACGWGESFVQALREHGGSLRNWVDEHFLLALCVFFVLYVLVTGLSVPVANVLSIAAGALFGRWLGLVLISFASTAGATLAFLGSRYLFRDAVQRRFGPRLEAINRNVEAEGAYYLLSLRLLFVVPFWLVNLAMGLTRMRVWTFWWVSQVGMLPGTFLYVNAGDELGRITSPKDIVSLPVLISFAVLGLVPLAVRRAAQWRKTRKATWFKGG
jgi:uncharacterized membrane protein YdjX (TVP38/TMEM64 family)